MKITLVALCICAYVAIVECESGAEASEKPLIRKEVIDSFALDVKKIKNISPQAESDFVHVAMQLNQDLSGYAFFTGTVTEELLKVLDARNKKLTSTEIEDYFNKERNNKKYSQKDIENLINETKEARNELEVTLKEKIPAEQLSRILSFMKIFWGNKEEIDAGLAYLYGSKAA